ncbi:MAG: hypothetical protein IKI77_06615 [Oscillospiraceae bacterium]|nr:hypothetical protein [Oscillospiraceae bacterium]
MKPEELLDAMKNISPDYIAEAKPVPQTHTESPNPKRAAANRANAGSAVLPEDAPRGNAARGKDIIMKKQSVIQRVLTGTVAAAACAVFVGGGWFIAKQAKQQRLAAESEISSETEEISESSSETEQEIPQTETNFLGGQGEVRVLSHAVLNWNLSNAVMYDDTRWYFRSGTFYADRTDAAASAFTKLPEEIAAIGKNTLYDGARFYFADGRNLYTMEQDGTRSETPFFTLTDEMLHDGQDGDALRFHRIVPMDENSYLISMEQSEGVYEAASGQAEDYRIIQRFVAILHVNDGTTDVLAETVGHEHFLPAGDGSVFAISQDGTQDTGIIRIQPDGSCEDVTTFDGTGNSVDAWSLHGEQLYVLLTWDDTDPVHGAPFRNTSRAAIDLNTHDITQKGTVCTYDNEFFVNPDNNGTDCLISAFTDGEQEFVIRTIPVEKEGGGSYGVALYSTDPEWSDLHELCRFSREDESLPYEVRSRADSTLGAYCSYNAYADSQYVVMVISAHMFSVCDRETGAVQYFYADNAPEGEIVPADVLHLDESRFKELDPGFTGKNFLGGTGSLHINRYVGNYLMYDDDNYYFDNFYLPRSSNEPHGYSDEIKEQYGFNALLYGPHLFSDGEQLFVQRGEVLNRIDSSGKETPFILLESTGLAGENERLDISRIHRVGNYYFVSGSVMPESETNLDFYKFCFWTDSTGKFISGRNDYQNTFFDPSDSEGVCDYIYMFDDNQITRMSAPEGEAEPLTFKLPGKEKPQYSQMLIDGEKILYRNENGMICAYDTDTAEYKELLHEDDISPDFDNITRSWHFYGQYIYYNTVDQDAYTNSLCRYDLNTGEKETLLTLDFSETADFMTCTYDNVMELYLASQNVLYNTDTGEYVPLVSDRFRSMYEQ